jgi:hypothetical protein
MSDYKELLERAERCAKFDIPIDPRKVVLEVAAALRAVIAERDATESERKHWENTAGCLRTDLEYMTRERDALKERNFALQDKMEIVEAREAEVIAQAEARQRQEDANKIEALLPPQTAASSDLSDFRCGIKTAAAAIRKGET